MLQLLEPGLHRLGDGPVAMSLMQQLFGQLGGFIALGQAVPGPVDDGELHGLAGRQGQAVQDLAQRMPKRKPGNLVVVDISGLEPWRHAEVLGNVREPHHLPQHELLQGEIGRDQLLAAIFADQRLGTCRKGRRRQPPVGEAGGLQRARSHVDERRRQGVPAHEQPGDDGIERKSRLPERVISLRLTIGVDPDRQLQLGVRIASTRLDRLRQHDLHVRTKPPEIERSIADVIGRQHTQGIRPDDAGIFRDRRHQSQIHSGGHLPQRGGDGRTQVGRRNVSNSSSTGRFQNPLENPPEQLDDTLRLDLQLIEACLIDGRAQRLLRRRFGANTRCLVDVGVDVEQGRADRLAEPFAQGRRRRHDPRHGDFRIERQPHHRPAGFRIGDEDAQMGGRVVR